jgi:neutral ceramidase
MWKRTNSVLGQSEATVVWEILPTTKPGLYRITHTGAHKTIFQQIKQYQGTTNSFKVVEKQFY